MVVSMFWTSVLLAIPLTANMHTPKLIEMFIRDRLNQAVLFGGAFLAFWERAGLHRDDLTDLAALRGVVERAIARSELLAYEAVSPLLATGRPVFMYTRVPALVSLLK